MGEALSKFCLACDMTSEQMWIAGEWCDAEDGAVGDALNPATGEVIATVPKATISDVDRCVQASRSAFNVSILCSHRSTFALKSN